MQALSYRNRNFYLSQLAVLSLAILCGINAKISLLLILAVCFLFLAKARPWISLALFIIILPLSNTAFLSFRLGDIPGLDLSNFFLFSAFVMLILSRNHLNLASEEIFVLTLVVLVYSISFTRSMPYLQYINEFHGTSMTYAKYSISFFVKPLTFILPFLLISGYVRSKDKIEFIYKVLILSILVTSVIVIYSYIFIATNKANWAAVRFDIGRFFGLHSNDIAIFYVITYPFILGNFIYRKSVYSISCLAITLVSVALLYSRTAYILVLFSTILMFLVEKRKKWFIAFCAVLVLFLTFSATTVKQRIMGGIESEDVSTISAGRVNQIWPSVVRILEKEPSVLAYGKGRYAIIYADPIQKGHPHNAYLEAILDSGLLGLLCFLLFYFYVLKKIKLGLARTEDEHLQLILKAAFISIIVYMISGVSGRHFFPHINNSYLWVVMGLGLAATKAMPTKTPEEITGGGGDLSLT